VTGCYQSYENGGFDVDGLLKIHRVFGHRPVETPFRGSPGETLFRQIKQAIDSQMNQGKVGLIPSRRTEIDSQMDAGTELLEATDMQRPAFVNLTWGAGLDEYIISTERSLNAPDALRRRRNLEEAIKAFQTVLLLDPTNRAGKFYLAACLRSPTIEQREDAREYYRQLLEDQAQDKWESPTRQDLYMTFDGETPERVQSWFAAAAARSTNPRAKECFQQMADNNANYVTFLRTRNTTNGIDLDRAKTNLLRALESLKNPAANPNHWGVDAYMGEFARAFGTNCCAAARALADFLPEMIEHFPELRPELQGAVVSRQVDTNASVIADFQKTLDWYSDHPEEAKSREFWNGLDYLLPWCYRQGCDRLAETIVEIDREGPHAKAFGSGDERLPVALDYFKHEQWRDALRMFQCYSNRPATVLNRGQRLGPVLTGRYADYCAKKLGVPHEHDPREFDIGEPCLDLDDGGVFVLDSAGAWIGGRAELRHVDLDLNTNLRVPLPLDAGIPITCLCVGDSKVWVGTGGAGLVEVDKASHECRRFTERDGMLMNSIARLHVSSGSLWIGYGQGTLGGLGEFALSSHRFRSFMPATVTNMVRADLTTDPFYGPPRHSVIDIETLANGDVLALASAGALHRFSPSREAWETVRNQNGYSVACFAADGRYLVERIINRRGLDICTLRDQRWQTLTDPDGMPNDPGSLALDGDGLWVLGEGFIAWVDPEQLKVRRFCYIPTVAAHGIRVGSGYVWAHADRHLYRTPLRDLR
jgi:hypothetical protein